MDVVPRRFPSSDHGPIDHGPIDQGPSDPYPVELVSIAAQPDDPYGRSQNALPLALGALIALLTAALPLMLVVGGRSDTLVVPLDSALSQVSDP